MTRRPFAAAPAVLLLAALVASLSTCRLGQLLSSSASRVRATLTVVPTTVTDSARAGSDDVRRASIAITNGGTAESFEWTATERHSWVRVSPREGTVPDTITISLDPEALDPGTYEGEVVITASGVADSQATIAVTFVAQRPGLAVTPRSIAHQTNVNSGAGFSDTLRITNSGSGELTWTARHDRPWLALGRTSGSGAGSVPVTINTAGLPPGTHSDEIVITAPGATGSPARVDVTLTIHAPGLAVTPGEIRDTASFGSTSPHTHRLRVSNSGSGEMTWTAAEDAPWLSLSASGGGVPADVDVTVSPAGLPAGVHRDTIVFTSPEATNDPILVPVELNVTSGVLAVTPPSIADAAVHRETARRVHTLTISNGGAGLFVWTATRDRSWIALSPEGGVASPSATLTVTLDPGTLSPGTHNGAVTVSAIGASGSPVTVPVTLTITRGCDEMDVTPDDLITGSLGGGDCEAPHRPGRLADLYAVTLAAGDTLSLRLTAAFDAYLVLSNPAGSVIAENDECPGESRTACLRDVRITAAGRHLIEVTSGGPGETGGYALTVTREAAPPPAQGAGQFRLDGTTALTVGGATTENAVVFKATINDPNPRDSIRLEVELLAAGSGFANAPTHTSDFVAATSGNGRTAQVQAGGLANGTGYHWQFRVCDRTQRCSSWKSFPQPNPNAESDADFRVVTPSGRLQPRTGGGP